MRRRPIPFPEEESVDEPLVNLTPLIDVVFVVLISFLLIAPILPIDSIQLAPHGNQEKQQTSSTQNQSVAIAIHADNRIFFQGKPITLSDLKEALLLEKKRKPSEVPQVIPDARAHFATYQRVKNLLESCGFEQMHIVLKDDTP